MAYKNKNFHHKITKEIHKELVELGIKDLSIDDVSYIILAGLKSTSTYVVKGCNVRLFNIGTLVNRRDITEAKKANRKFREENPDSEFRSIFKYEDYERVKAANGNRIKGALNCSSGAIFKPEDFE